jgi:hypothetical protein
VSGRETARRGGHVRSAADIAFLKLLEHVQSCEQCTDDSSRCPTGRALIRTHREALRRP